MEFLKGAWIAVDEWGDADEMAYRVIAVQGNYICITAPFFDYGENPSSKWILTETARLMTPSEREKTGVNGESWEGTGI